MSSRNRSEAAVHGPVARRLLGLFILCAVVPTTCFALYTEGRVTRQLLAQADRQLASSAKWEGVQIFERLTALSERVEESLRAAADRPSIGSDSTAPFERLRGECSRIGIVDLGTRQRLGGEPVQLPELTEAQRDHLDSGRPLLINSLAPSPSDSEFQMVRTIDEERTLILRLRPAAIWGPRAVSIARERIDVFSGKGALAETTVLDELSFEDVIPWGVRDLHPFEWSLHETSMRASAWTLPLEFTFGGDPWTVVASEDLTSILEPVRGFRSTFFRLVAITALIVSYLGLRLIRRQVRPLSVLLDGTRKVASGALDTRIEIGRRDEFGVLAADFNAMTAQLERHFWANETVRSVTEAVLAVTEVDGVVRRVLDSLPQLLPEAKIQMLLDTPVGIERHWQPFADLDSPPLTSLVPIDAPQHAELRALCISDLRARGPHGWIATLVDRDESDPDPWIFPMVSDREFLGALAVIGELTPTQCDFTRQVVDQATIALANTRLLSSLETMSWDTLCILARTVDAKSSWTAGHSDRVARISRRLAAHLGYPESRQERIYRGALIHDVGKVGTPMELLDKNSALTPEEYDRMKDHVLIGCRILDTAQTYAPLIPIVRSHHERFDGNGYPDGLIGTAIPEDARLVAIADAFDAMVSDRPYREGLEIEEALRRLRAGSGTQFDPAMADAMLGLAAREPHALEPIEVEG